MIELDIRISPCPNDVFIFGGLISGHTGEGGYKPQFSFHDVETLNGMSRQEGWDALKISAAALSGLQRKVTMLNCGGAMGYGCGPLLLTGKKSKNTRGPIVLPGKMTTAGMLYRFYAREKGLEYQESYLPYDQLYEGLCSGQVEKGVVIHESRFTYQDHGLGLVQDLGAFWEEKTGLPIPLGVIVSRGSVEMNDWLNRQIPLSLQWSRQNREEALELCSHYAQELEKEVLEAHIEMFVNDFSMEMGEKGKKAVQVLLEAADNQLGLVL